MREGRGAIEEWRKLNPTEVLDLAGADLTWVNLAEANLERADLAKANLLGSSLRMSKLAGARLYAAHLHAVPLWGSDLRGADLSYANLTWGDLTTSDLTNANLRHAMLNACTLLATNFRGANLEHARLSRTNVFGTTFENANLADTLILGANFTAPDLRGTKLQNVRLGATSISFTDLSKVVGLEKVEHLFQSFIGIDTLIQTFRGAGDKLTSKLTKFFLNAGVPSKLLSELPRIVAAEKYFSCFIAYGHPDLRFARRLVKDLKNRGVPYWLYELDATPGKPTWPEIGQMRRTADKVIIICSSEALKREGLLKEIEDQVDNDPNEIVPISLDEDWRESGFEVRRGTRDLKHYLLERNYVDFSKLPYQKALIRLLNGLKRRA